ncbi:uncharacterized protein BO96DRAFT_331982, partial [Aspergillus niger CBS 101883]|uniref:uncharacterized protein n=1 Tax=Aspergillus lacticoffeatus (strain CBS 101883) TaxID=1450533 RepID=UPI000D7F53A2
VQCSTLSRVLLLSCYANSPGGALRPILPYPISPVCPLCHQHRYDPVREACENLTPGPMVYSLIISSLCKTYLDPITNPTPYGHSHHKDKLRVTRVWAAGSLVPVCLLVAGPMEWTSKSHSRSSWLVTFLSGGTTRNGNQDAEAHCNLIGGDDDLLSKGCCW